MPDGFLNPFAVNIRDRSVMLEIDEMQLSLRRVSLTCAFEKPYLAQQWAFTTTDPNEDLRVFDFGYYDIIVSHGPPLNCLDRTKSGSRIGSPVLQKHILEHQPPLVVCGHVHEAAGIQGIRKTMVINTARRWQLITLTASKNELHREYQTDFGLRGKF
jgi:Icc-related predicted phosphoesterase